MSGTDVTITFENEFAKWMGLSHTVAYTSGTMALAAAMFSIGLGRGDELICPSLTYWASCIQAYLFGATPVFCDVDPNTLCIDQKDFERRITPNTKAVMVVHYIGHPADMDAIMAIAKKHNIKVIEDVSHAQGGLYKGKKLGTFGDVAAMSLMSGKSFAIGEAGIFVTNNRKYYERALVYGHYERNNTDNITDPDLLPLVGLPLGDFAHPGYAHGVIGHAGTTVADTLPMGSRIRRVATTGNTAYAALSTSGSVSAVDLTGATVAWTLVLGGQVADLAVNGANTLIAAAANGAQSQLYLINPATHLATDSIPLAVPAVQRLALLAAVAWMAGCAVAVLQAHRDAGRAEPMSTV
jgi:hypothetical protein